MDTFLLIGGLILFVLLVVVHEFGHFLAARRNGVEVEEFGIGFPPKMFIFYKDKKGTVFTWNWLPLGGFVRLKGEHDEDKGKGTFGAASFWAKTKIILAGVAMNLLTAWLMLTLLAIIGMPKLPLPGGEEQFTVASDTSVISNKVFVGYVEPGGPADQAGLQAGDELIIGPYNPQCDVLEFDSQDTAARYCTEQVQASEVRDFVEQYLKAGSSQIQLSVVRDGEYLHNIVISPRSLEEVEASKTSDSPKGYLGIVPYDYTIQRSTWSAPIVGAGLIVQYSKLTYSALGSAIVDLFSGRGSEASQNVAGPVGIFVVLRDGASLGISYVLLVIALLSLTLAIMNTLPIPALDGGKLAVMGLFRLIKKPLTPQLEERIHGTGLVVLLSLFVVITIVDVRRFF